MKTRLLITLFFSLTFSFTFAQNSDFKVGDTFTIGKVENENYKHINFPKTNFIIKKGGLANYDDLYGKKVEITSIKEKANGNLIATIKLSSEKRFFNSHKYATVAINDALKNRELNKI